MALWLRLFGGTALLVGVYFAVPVQADGNLALRVSATVLGLALTVALIAREIRRVAHSPLWGLALALVTGVLAFAMADYLVAVSKPGEFADLNTRVDALYFAVTTLATVGFGDIHAQSQAARVLVTIQMAFNILVLATGGSVLLNQIRSRHSPRQQ